MKTMLFFVKEQLTGHECREYFTVLFPEFGIKNFTIYLN
jgi:hypothetical protein